MTSFTIQKLILNDQVETASTLVKDTLKRSEDAERVALDILKALSAALTKSSRNHYVCKSESKHMFKVADTCSKAVSKTWKCKQCIFMQCVYHICKYFISKKDFDFAKQLTLYFFEIKTKRNGLIWNKDEKTVLDNILLDFINGWFFESNSNVFGMGDSSVVSQWNFIFSLSELNNYENVCFLFHAATKILSKISDVDINHKLGCKMFNQFCTSVPNGAIVLKTESNFNTLLLLVNSYFWAMQYDNFVKLNHTELIDFLKSVVCNVGSSCIKSIVDLLLIFRDPDPLNFESIVSNINNLTGCKNLDSFTIKIVLNLLKFFSSKTASSSLDGDTLLNILKCLYNSKKTCINDKNLSKCILMALQIVLNSEEEKTQLKQFYLPVLQMINIFFTNQNSSYLDSAVYSFTKIMLSLHKVGLHFESMQIGRLLIIKLRKVEFTTEPSARLKNNVDCMLQTFVKSSALGNVSFECLVFLLALSQDTSPLFQSSSNQFQYWCQLKQQPRNNVEDITVHHLMNIDNERVIDKSIVEDFLKWPYSVVVSLDLEHLLLLEIRSYLKHKDLMNSVLAVYRVAVSNVKCKLTLARIVCCATKAVTESTVELPTIKKFHQSVHNMIKILSKTGEELDEIDKALVLGDLYYYLARCVITTQRKFAQSQVVSMVPELKLDEIPVPEDPLNSTVVVNEFSFISYCTQEEVMAHLALAFEMWMQALVLLKKAKGGDKIKNDLGVSLSLKYMKESGYIYRLYKNIKKETLVWQLLYDISTNLNIPKYRIIAFSELLCTLVHINTGIVDEMKIYVSNQPGIQSTYYYYLFHIALGRNQMYNLKVNDEIIQNLDKEKMKSWHLVQVQFEFYCYQLRCAQGLIGHKMTSELIQVFERSLIGSNISKNGFVLETVSQCLLLDISFLLGNYFLKARDVRLARLYTTKQFELSQKLHLPIRTCNFLTLHANIDLICVNCIDLTKKISGVETILELSHKGLIYELHKPECKCRPCDHIEYQIAFAYAILLKTCLIRLSMDTTDCLEALKVCRELISGIKKSFDFNLVTDFLECSIQFNMIAVEALMDLGKLDKASKYSEQAMKYINHSYKPCIAELSSVNICNIRMKVNLPKLTSSPIVLIKEVELGSTPQPKLEITSPPPICWKQFTPDPKKNIGAESNHRVKFKKLVFDETPHEKDCKIQTDLENNDNVNEINSVSTVKKHKDPETSTRPPGLIPTIVVSAVNDKENTSSPIYNKIDEVFITPLATNKRVNKLKKTNFTTPRETSVPVFCDVQVSSVGTKSRKNRVKKKFNLDSKPSVIIIHSDEENVELINSRTKLGNTVPKVKETVQSKRRMSSKRLFLLENSDKDNCLFHTSDYTLLPKDDDQVINSSSDDCSIIDATVFEEPVESRKFHLTPKSPQVTALEEKLSTLCVTPTSTSPLALPLPTTVRKYTRRAKTKTVSTKPEETANCENANIKNLNLLSLNQSEFSPITVRKTRSSKRLLLK